MSEKLKYKKADLLIINNLKMGKEACGKRSKMNRDLIGKRVLISLLFAVFLALFFSGNVEASCTDSDSNSFGLQPSELTQSGSASCTGTSNNCNNGAVRYDNCTFNQIKEYYCVDNIFGDYVTSGTQACPSPTPYCLDTQSATIGDRCVQCLVDAHCGNALYGCNSAYQCQQTKVYHTIQVIDDDTNQNISGATVTFKDSTGADLPPKTTGSNGRTSNFILDIGEVYTLTITKNGYGTRIQNNWPSLSGVTLSNHNKNSVYTLYPVPKCSETDGGNVDITQGITTNYTSTGAVSVSKTDFCITSGANVGKLNEYYCSSSASPIISQAIISCSPKVCQNGACVTPTCTDSDGDGYSSYHAANCPSGDDCNDANPSIHPGANDICNSIDRDCDGIRFENCPACTLDTDCNDDNPCTDDSCNAGNCAFVNDNTNSCNDNLFCTQTDSCQNGVCLGAGNPCPGGSCIESSDTCSEVAECGNGVYDSDAGEVCDIGLDGEGGTNDDVIDTETSCLTRGYDSGDLKCSEGCLAFDESDCEETSTPNECDLNPSENVEEWPNVCGDINRLNVDDNRKKTLCNDNQCGIVLEPDKKCQWNENINKCDQVDINDPICSIEYLDSGECSPGDTTRIASIINSCDPNCAEGCSSEIVCPRIIALPFFSVFNFVLSLGLIGIAYVFILKKREKECV